MHRNLPIGTRISYGGDAFRAPSHGVIKQRHLDEEDSVIYEVETWDGFIWPVNACDVSEVLS